jgi:hypothetical protein
MLTLFFALFRFSMRPSGGTARLAVMAFADIVVVLPL